MNSTSSNYYQTRQAQASLNQTVEELAVLQVTISSKHLTNLIYQSCTSYLQQGWD